jgi:hypothetical protein
LAKRAKNNDAIMTGILVTRFKMGLIGVEELEEMAADTTRAERALRSHVVLRKILGTLRNDKGV